MDIASYVLAGQEQALKRRMDVTANNMANVSTTGFKRERPVFRDEIVDAGTQDVRTADETAFVLDQPVVHDFSAGGFTVTANPLDLMIEGSGYLTVQRPDGTTAYTRAGSLRVDAGGALTTATSAPVLGAGGQPIRIAPEDQATLHIAGDGAVMGAGREIGRLSLTRFADESTLVPLGDASFSGTGGTPVPAGEVKVKTGGLEGSNVDAIQETTQMIDILRTYQSSMRMADSLTELRRNAIDRLGRVS